MNTILLHFLTNLSNFPFFLIFPIGIGLVFALGFTEFYIARRRTGPADPFKFLSVFIRILALLVGIMSCGAALFLFFGLIYEEILTKHTIFEGWFLIFLAISIITPLLYIIALLKSFRNIQRQIMRDFKQDDYLYWNHTCYKRKWREVIMNNENWYKFNHIGFIVTLAVDLLLILYIVFFKHFHPNVPEMSALFVGICAAILFLMDARARKKNF